MLTLAASILIALSMMGLQVAIVILLARKYLQTREVGFIWLGAAVVIWPLASRVLDWGKRFAIESHWLKGHIIGNFMTLTNFTQQFIGTILVFLAVLYLSRMNGTGSRASQA
jgi:hypothetical protein